MSYSSEVLADSPVAYWRLDETSGTSAADATGNGRTGTYSGTPALASPSLLPVGGGSAVGLDGVNDTITVPNHASLNAVDASGFTFECWVRIDDPSANKLQVLADKTGLTQNNKQWAVFWDNRSAVGSPLALKAQWGYLAAGGTVLTWAGAVARDSLAAGGHLVVTFAGAVASIYWNGVLVQQGAVTNGGNVANTRSVDVGHSGGSSFFLDGTLDEVAVYAKALTSDRVVQHYASGDPAGTGPPVAGSLAAVGPAHAAALAGTVVGAPVTGAFAAVAPAHTAAMSGTVAGAAVVLDGWGRDLSQRALLRIVPGTAVLRVAPALAAAPATVTERPLRRQSHVMPTLAPDAEGRVSADGTHEVIEEDFGVPHLFIANRDVTYFRGAPVQIGEWRSSEPGGDEYVTLAFPQLTAFDTPGVGDLDWLKADSPVDIVIIRPDGSRSHQFAGYLVSNTVQGGGADVSWQAEGVLKQPDYFGHRVPTILDPTDIGTMIAKHLNGVISRKYAPLKAVATGILTRKRGSYSDSEWDYVQELLATAWTVDGQQWTLARTATPRAFVLKVKDTVTNHWTLTTGAPGVQVNLTADQTQVVDAIYGRGVGPDGYSWAGWTYPNLGKDSAPAYPYASAGTFMTVGSTDAGTVSGEGVTVWQERARQLGMTLAVDGVFSAADAEAAREIQRRHGLLIDGVVGGQTWAATFAVGANAGSLAGAYRRPLAVNPEFEPYLYNADGSIAGENPAYNPARLRHERDIDFGPGVTKAEAARSARAEMNRDSAPRHWAGTITLETDPHEGSRFEMFEGHNVTLLGWRDYGTLRLHIADVQKSLSPPRVTLTVDTLAQDAMALSAVLERDRSAKADPARRPGNMNRRSHMEQDAVVEFDGESGAGVIPRHALTGGLWSVICVPVSQVGRVAKVELRTTGPAAPFAAALFGSEIQPSHLARYIGNPLASDSPLEANRTLLEDRYGLIEGWGQNGQACGYEPAQDRGGSLTGRHIDVGGFEYVSQRPPWIWVALYSPTSTFIQGRIYPAPVQ